MPTAVIPSPRPAADKPNRPADPAVESAAFGKFIKGRVGGKRAKNKRQQQRQQQQAPPEAVVIGAYSIEEFCKAHGGLSESMFHKLCREGRGPAIMKVGARTLISAEAAAAWRQALTVE
jgi:hypothetical protein